MKKYDIIVIGAGTGLDIASRSAQQGKKVALIEPGPLGGTCLNRGCIPSKMLIHSADVMEQIQRAEDFGIETKIKKVNFSSIVNRVTTIVDNDSESIANGISDLESLDWYKSKASFTDKKIVKVEDEEITADKILIAAGTRPFIPPIEGIEDVEYMTNKEALRRTDQPKSMIVIGGGYIAAELAHFYGALGTEITVIERGERLISAEDKEVSELFTKLFSEKYTVRLNASAKKVEKTKKGIKVFTDEGEEFEAEALLIATGRKSNADTLNLEEVGYELTERKYVKNNEYLQTSVEGVYTLGDIAGNYFFKHSANHEAGFVWNNIWKEDQKKVDYTAMPHAIFSSPQIAGVGKTEQELEESGIEYKVGKQMYSDTGMGQALQEQDGFVKVLLNEENEILGCHIIGPEASTLIHEVVVAMKYGDKKAEAILNSVHIHPALNEVVQRAFYKARYK